jgi:uridine phosphorylase
MFYPPSELVLDQNNQVYHLGLSPEQLADNVILVGDQDRVSLVSACFDSIEFDIKHREFHTQTGSYKGKRITVISTGIGTDNIDIVLNELDALVNIDLINRLDLATKRSLNLIRIGTCGILQADIPILSYLLSTHACGLDNVAHFYAINTDQEEDKLLMEIKNQLSLPETIQPYLSRASANLVDLLQSDKTHQGITVTSSGFYGPQGRQLRLPLKINNLNDRLIDFLYKDHRILNFEMESSALFALGKALGHNCATICLGIANRPANTFSAHYEGEMRQLIQYVLDRLK